MRIPDESPSENSSISKTPKTPKMIPKQPNAVNRFPTKTTAWQRRLCDKALGLSFELSFI
jgi:hypothetical protein